VRRVRRRPSTVIAALAIGLAVMVTGAPGTGAEPAEGTSDPLTGVVSTSGGNYHGCAVVTGGRLRCWGYNSDGQLGTGNTTDTLRAVLVRNATNTGPLSDVVDVTTARYHSCALLGSGEVRCWGGNGSGQLGDGTVTDRLLPRPVLAPSGPGRLTGVTQISASDQTTCARLANGQARCWGWNNNGQLGNGTLVDRSRPAVVKRVTGAGPLTGVTQIDMATYHTCARLVNGQARCWGANDDGQLGDDTEDPRLRPVVVVAVSGVGALTGVRQISAGEFHTCAALLNGRARCWGDNDQLRLGNGSSFDTSRPGIVVGTGVNPQLTDVRAVVAGGRSSCALLTTGQVRCWGDNDYGEIGNGTIGSTNYASPVAVRNPMDTANLAGATQMEAMSFTFCARVNGAQARCWGYGDTGGLGNGAGDNSGLPVKVLT